MTTITIPKSFGYPTVDIVVNNQVHTLKSGEEISVDDHIAEVIENAMALAPKIGRNKSRLAELAEGSITELPLSDLDGVETIAYYAFGQCYSLTSIEIPSSVKSIGANAFTGCKGVTSVRFGGNSKLDSIGNNAFDWCTSLAKVYLPETPPSLSNVNAFANIKTNCVFYCKTQASLNAYKVAPNWSTLAGTYTFKVEA